MPHPHDFDSDCRWDVKARIFSLLIYSEKKSDLGSGGPGQKNSENDQMTGSGFRKIVLNLI